MSVWSNLRRFVDVRPPRHPSVFFVPVVSHRSFTNSFVDRQIMASLPTTLPNGDKVKMIGDVEKIASFDTSLHLLPLLRPSRPSKPPLHLLSGGSTSKERIAFETSSATWVVTTHVFPCAYPRSHAQSVARSPEEQQPPPNVELMNASKDKQLFKRLRSQDLERGTKRLASLSITPSFSPTSIDEANERATSLAQQEQPTLWNTVERIVPVRREKSVAKRSRGLTLVLYHANGFHKEIWEPMLRRLIEHMEDEQECETHIEEIWSLDHYNSGEAGVLNRASLGAAMPWFDHARDILQFVQYYMPAPSTLDELELYGPKWPPTELIAQSTQDAGRKGRKIVGVCHSIGGAAMTMAAMTAPTVFDGIIAVDPMIGPIEGLTQHPIPGHNVNSMGAFGRSDTFANKKDVLAYMNERSFFQVWDGRVRELHASYGFSPIDPQQPQKGLALNMSKWSEGFSFAHEFTNTWAMRALRDRLSSYGGWINYLYSEAFSANNDDLWDRSSKTTKRLFEEKSASSGRRPAPFCVEFLRGNHLVVLEEPDRVGVKLAKILLERAGERDSTTSDIPKARM